MVEGATVGWLACRNSREVTTRDHPHHVDEALLADRFIKYTELHRSVRILSGVEKAEAPCVVPRL